MKTRGDKKRIWIFNFPMLPVKPPNNAGNLWSKVIFQGPFSGKAAYNSYHSFLFFNYDQSLHDQAPIRSLKKARAAVPQSNSFPTTTGSRGGGGGGGGGAGGAGGGGGGGAGGGAPKKKKKRKRPGQEYFPGKFIGGCFNRAAVAIYGVPVFFLPPMGISLWGDPDIFTFF